MAVFGLRHVADLRTFFFMATYFGWVTWQWRNYESYQHNAAIRTVFFLLTAFTAFQGAVTTHNIVHCPMFPAKSVWSNRLSMIATSLWFGHACSAYVPGHNLSHHRHLETARDFMRTNKMQYGWNLLNLLMFFPNVVVSSFKNDGVYFDVQKKRGAPIYAQFRREMGAYLTVQACLVLLNWQKWLAIFFLPHVIGKACIVSLNILQHDGCDAESEFNHSRNFVGRALNLLCFNNGFHAIHHAKPYLHWSLCKDAHQKAFQGRNHPNLDRSSIWGYIFEQYVYPGRRTRFDGKPVVLRPVKPDAPWILPNGKFVDEGVTLDDSMYRADSARGSKQTRQD